MCLEELLVESFNKSKIEAKQEAYKEVLKWLDENFYDVHVLHDDRLEGDFESKEQMLRSFKERFNIE